MTAPSVYAYPKNNREAVLFALKEGKIGRNGQWMSGELLKFVGGSEALRRVRELRAEGYTIESRRPEWGGTHEYRIVGRTSR